MLPTPYYIGKAQPRLRCHFVSDVDFFRSKYIVQNNAKSKLTKKKRRNSPTDGENMQAVMELLLFSFRQLEFIDHLEQRKTFHNLIPDFKVITLQHARDNYPDLLFGEVSAQAHVRSSVEGPKVR